MPFAGRKSRLRNHHSLLSPILDFTIRDTKMCSSGDKTQQIGRPWPANFVPYRALSRDQIRTVQCVVEEANDEAPIQSWLEANPEALLAFLQGQTDAWVFPRPSLAGKHIPDFMICERDSRGYQWHLVELESPRSKVLTRTEMQRAELTHAKKQILDCRNWLRENIQYAQNELRFHGLDGEFLGYVVIGRRKNLGEDRTRTIRALSRDVSVWSYDRLIERMPKEREDAF